MSRRPFELIERHVNESMRADAQSTVSHLPQTLDAADIVLVGLSGRAGRTAVVAVRHQPGTFLGISSRSLTLARLEWVRTMEGPTSLDDPVACPCMALSMAKAGAHSQGLSVEQVRAAIAPWLTKDEVEALEKRSEMVNGDNEPAELSKQLGAIAEALTRRAQERALAAKLGRRRDEALDAAAGKPASKTASR